MSPTSIVSKMMRFQKSIVNIKPNIHPYLKDIPNVTYGTIEYKTGQVYALRWRSEYHSEDKTTEIKINDTYIIIREDATIHLYKLPNNDKWLFLEGNSPQHSTAQASYIVKDNPRYEVENLGRTCPSHFTNGFDRLHLITDTEELDQVKDIIKKSIQQAEEKYLQSKEYSLGLISSIEETYSE